MDTVTAGRTARGGRAYADLVIRAGRIHTLADDVPPQQALAVLGDRIVEISQSLDGLDGWIGPDTILIEEPGAAVLPSFDDTHAHLVFAGLDAFAVPAHHARSLAELLELIRERAATTPPGEWIITTTNWQELDLAERRMPTARELDGATSAHPVLVRRGGHNAVANSQALRMAGIDERTQPPDGGILGRNEDGSLNGRLIDAALHMVEPLLPRPPVDRRIAGLDQASYRFAATGIGTVRDCAVPIDDLDVFQATHAAGRLNTRVRALVMAQGAREPAQLDELLDRMEPWRYRADPWLRVWGVKFVLDGGLEAGATEEAYLGRDDGFRGLLLWSPEVLERHVDRVVRRGWRVGTHAFGDRAVRVLIDVYERVLARNPWLPPNSLVIEHGGLASPEQRARAVALGLPVTVQLPLLHDTAHVGAGHWGAELVAQLFPAREWLDDGALVTAGSDFPVGQFGAMRSVWGLVTRQTVAGVQGPQHAITVAESIRLHTTDAALLFGEQDLRGALTPGRLADLTVWPIDPFTCPVDRLRDLQPTATVVGGRVRHPGSGTPDPSGSGSGPL